MQEVPFSSLFAYKPKSQQPAMEGLTSEAYNLTIALKKGRKVNTLLNSLRTSLSAGDFTDLFGDDVVVVPAPGHAPIRSPDQFWATFYLANAITAEFGGRVRCYLKRRVVVNKAAYARPEDRPTFRLHLNTIDVEPTPELFRPQRITVVDDVITRGATLAACVCRLKQVYPNAKIKSFAAVRTLHRDEALNRIKDPINDGRIHISSSRDTTRRRP